MQLFLLGYNTHHEVFEKYINVDNAASRFALAQLVGNIKTAQSRNILVALLADENSLVQGEAVRQLKTWPPEDVAPHTFGAFEILERTKFRSIQYYGPCGE